MLENYRHNHKGWYVVGDQKFTNKIEAYYELNRIIRTTNTVHDIHWDYHDDIFDKVVWTAEPPININEIYKNRALQIREQYDHVVLFYSGGVDSETMLNAFVDNNIRFDEIFIYGAFNIEHGALQKFGYSREPGYYTREYYLHVEPRLKELQKTHNFKITVWDWGDKIIETLDTNPDWFMDVGTRMAPDAIPRKFIHEVFRHNDVYEEKGKTAAFVYGVDKPRLFRDDTDIYFSFIDMQMTTGVGNSADINKKTWENDEFFYWTPNMPELVVKQAHLIYNYLKRTNGFHRLTHKDQLAGFHLPEYYDMVHPIIYPKWDNRWQIKKPTSPVRDETGGWLFTHAPEKTQQRWWDGLIELERQLGHRWFNNNTVYDGLIGCYSKFYKIGPITSDFIAP